MGARYGDGEAQEGGVMKLLILAGLDTVLAVAGCGGGQDPRTACPQSQPGPHLVSDPTGGYKWEFPPGARIVQCK
jgi:hypothetical protein